MNHVSLIGRIAREMELRDSSNGSKFCGFTIAVSEHRGANEYTNFIPCIAYDKQAENMVKFLSKGSLVGVVGRISVRTNNDNGRYQTIVNIVADRVEFLESKNKVPSTNYSNLNSNYDMDQINTFEPSNNDFEQNKGVNEDEIIISDNDSILWD